ncbi:MAG: amidohydrolase family protein [Armatimonadota bacterium]
MIVDIHTHTFPDALAERAIATLAATANETACTDGTNAGLRASMRRAGIDLSTIMPIATKPGQARNINAWAAGVNKAYDDLICFGSLHPDQEDWAAEIERLVADGIPGVKFHPDYQSFFVDEPRMLPMYRALRDAGIIVMFHSGVDIGLPPPVHCPPDRLARVIAEVPGLTVIAAHMGAYAMWDEVERHLVGLPLYFDTSYSLADLGKERMLALIRAHGADKVLFGTDSPWTDQGEEVANLRDLGLTEEELSAILGGNAKHVLGLN